MLSSFILLLSPGWYVFLQPYCSCHYFPVSVIYCYVIINPKLRGKSNKTLLLLSLMALGVVWTKLGILCLGSHAVEDRQQLGLKLSRRLLSPQVWYVNWEDSKTWGMNQLDLLRHLHLSLVVYPCSLPSMAASAQPDFLHGNFGLQKRKPGWGFNTFYDLALEEVMRHCFATFYLL